MEAFYNSKNEIFRKTLNNHYDLVLKKKLSKPDVYAYDVGDVNIK